MKTNNPTFTKLYTQVLGMSTISGNAKLLLTFITSHIENNQKFIYTNEDLMEKLGIDSLSTMKRIIKELSDEELISTTIHKNFYINERNWGNRREVFLTQKTFDIINNIYEEKEVITDTLSTPIKETIQQEPKVAQIEEKPTKKELFDYSEECMKEFEGTDSLFGEVNAKINAGAIQTMIEVKSEFESQFNVKQKSKSKTSKKNNDKFFKLKEILNNQYPMKSDIEYCLPELLGDKYTSELSTRLAKAIIIEKINKDNIEEFINNYIK